MVKSVAVAVNRNNRVDLVLEVGGVTEAVEVSATASRIDSASAQLATTVERTYVSELPASTRSVLSFAELAPGVQMQNNGILPYLTGDLDSPNTTMSSKDFGSVLSRSGIRTVQLAVKFNY